MSSKRNILLLSSIVLLGAAAPSMARVDVGIDIGVAPPPPQVEVVPPMDPGYIWAPGYWAWQGGVHVWIPGHRMQERAGYHWVPDHWDARGGSHHFEPGHWDRGRG